MNKFITASILCFLLTGCTPAIHQQLKKEWAAVTEYNYLETLSVATGYRNAFPDNKEKMIRQDRNLCLHEDAHQRLITANGIEDQVGYNYCTLTPAPPATPHRWSGR